MKTKIIGLILLGLISISCTNSKPESETMVPAKLNKSYLALGDSYTIGESVPTPDRFPVILIQKLKERDILFDTPNIIAKTGWTTGELTKAINDANIQRNFDLVTLLIGVNNQYRGLSIDEYQTELRTLLQIALVFASNKPENVRVISIPDWGVSPFASGSDRDKIAREIDLFNAVKKSETEALNIAFIDITEVSRTALNNEQYFASDGLHFSREMHELWVEEILKSF
jgi:lysophospholipase L1-like esterase